MITRTVQLFVASALMASPVVAAAQATVCDLPDAVEVRRLRFVGNDTFRGYVLARSIVTEPTPLARRLFRLGLFGDRRCLDRYEFGRDSARIRVFYSQRGYFNTRVEAVERQLSPSSVEIRFNIFEGPPTIVERFTITGLDSVPERARIEAGLPLRAGEPFDQRFLNATRDTLTRRLRNSGYPAAEVLGQTETDYERRTATVRLDAEPGTRAHIGEIAVEITPRPATAADRGARQQISEESVRRLIGVRTGDLYSERRLEDAKRTLVLTEVYAGVLLELDSAAREPPGDSAVRVLVALSEGFTRSWRPSAGYGTLDCFRTDGEYRDNDFPGDGRRFELRARLSKIGIGRPLAGASGLCPFLRDDPYSVRLNYYAAATVSEPMPVWRGFRPNATLYSERRGEYNAYLRSTPIGGIVSATRQASRRTYALAYQLEYGRTEAAPAVFCALQNICLEEDRAPLLRARRLGVASAGFTQDWSNHPAYPSGGGVARVDLRHASTVIGSDDRLQFTRATVDFSLYFGLWGSTTLATRFRAGTVVGPSQSGTSEFIPPQERQFAGGSNSVRGFRQNDLGPKVYIARGYDTVRADGGTAPAGPNDTVFFRARSADGPLRSVPTGGSALVVANVELRLRSPVFPDRLHLTAFTDVGELWTPGAPQRQDRFENLKITPGLGVRIQTPVGPFRVDVAYNPYSPRAGAAFFDAPIQLGGQLYCVSPGNTLPVTGLGVEGSAPLQASGACAADFQPPQSRTFLRRLTWSFGIGQAF